LAIFIKLFPVYGHTGIEDRVKLVSVSSGEVRLNQRIDLLRRINLIAVKRTLEVVQLVGIGLR
jgi:hypothetical protein